MKKILLLGLLSFLIAVVLKTPAVMISSQLPINPPTTLHNVSGSLWKGSAKQLRINNINVGKVNWSISILGLLTGATQGNFMVTGEELTVSGAYRQSFMNKLTLKDTQFTTTGRLINQFQRYAKLAGEFRGTIDHLVMDVTEPLTPPVVSSVINWEQGSLSSPIKLAEGNYQLKISPEPEGQLMAKITSNNAPVEIKGHIVLDNQWQYETDLKLKATPRGESLQGMLSFAGQPQADGYIHIKEKGKLF